MKSNLTPRAMTALVTTALSAFLLLCFWGYTQADADSVHGPVGLADTLASWFVGPLGAGAWVIAVLGLAWGMIVYFEERTPDLVLRLVGTTALAASTAMLMGLVNGGKASVWAGTVGEAGARMMIGMGTAGTVLGWTVALALSAASLIFATDSLFNTLRRSGRPAYDPSLMPVEPSRGDLLESPADAEPRVFIRSESRAAVAVEHLATAEPRPLEVRPDSLPDGFSAAETKFGTVVRGPQGYEGVEFLTPSDELALPEAPRAVPTIEHRYDGLMDDDVNFDAAHFDPMISSELEEEHVALERAPAVHEPIAAFAVVRAPADDEAPTQDVATPSHDDDALAARREVLALAVAPAVAEPVAEPEHGIALADASLLVDEVFSFPTSDFDAFPNVPNDGASAASEIASTYTMPEPVAAPSSPAELPAVAVPAAVAAAPELTSEEPVSDEVVIPSFYEDDVVFSNGTEVGNAAVFGDDEIYVYDSGSGYEPQPTTFPEAVSIAVESAGVETGLALAVAERTTIGVAPEIEVAADEIAVAVPAPAPQLEVFQQVVAPVAPAVPDALTISQAIVIAVGELATQTGADERAVEVAPAASVADPMPMSQAAVVAVGAEEMQPEEMSVSQAIVIAVGDVPEVVATVVSEAVESTAPMIETSVAIETPAVVVAPVVEAARETVAAPVAADAPVVAQLALFPATTCDLSKLRTMELDPLFLDAAEAILTRGRASAVVLQRALGISYARGLRILDQMTEAAMLGPDSPGGSREICFTRDAWTAFLGRA
ncbi:MAG: hypothetical protein K8T90_15845 [Planctomycetes bacterium]|nr:hypothetical protein [Planctomycetota bacterium]